MRALAVFTVLPLVLTNPALAQNAQPIQRQQRVQTRGPGFLDSQVAKADPL